VVDDDSDDKVSEETLKKLGLLSNYRIAFVIFDHFTFDLILFVCHI